MSSVALPSIRHALRSCSSPLRLQRRWARVHDVRFVATQRNQQQILDRYKTKLERKAQQEGHQSLASLKEAYKDKITEFRRTADAIDGLPPTPDQPVSPASTPLPGSKQNWQHAPPPPPTAPAQPQPPPRSSSSASPASGGSPGIKPLSSYVDLEKLSQLPRKEIEYIWRLRFASNPLSLCAVIPIDTYERIYANARAHPQFILPLPRPGADDGSGDAKQSEDGFDSQQPRTAADIHFLQWAFHPPAGEPSAPVPGRTTRNTHVSTVLFTHLAAFKGHGAYAQPHTTVTHHLDLVDSHGIVLLQGAVVEHRGISPAEATWLLMCLQKFYDFEGHGGGVGREKRQGLLEKFSRGDAEGFRIEELMEEAERVS